MEIKVLPMGDASRYLSEVMEDLPRDCFFNKNLCGCGGTDLALTNKEPYIVVVPFLEIIRSKMSQKRYGHVYPVCYRNEEWLSGKIKNLELALQSDSYSKFLVTYASFQKVVKLLGYKTKSYRLLVDEAHMLTDADDKNYMRQQIYYILQSYKQFKSYCFMTSTPYEPKYFPEEITDMPFYKAEWSSTKPIVVTTQYVESNFPFAIASIAMDHVTGRRPGNAYFFYNSVQGIASVVKILLKAEYSVDQINIVASKSNTNYKGLKFSEVKSTSNEAYLRKYVHPDIRVKGVDECNSDVKHLNFFTATCFEGCDIYDQKGVTYVCSDGRKLHSRIEIHTKIPQIVNRIRNSQYKSRVYLLFSQPTLRDYTTEEEFLQSVEKDILETELLLADLHNATERVGKFLDKRKLDTHEFLIYDGSKYVINKNAKKRALSQWNAMHHTYYVFDQENRESLYKVESKSKMIILEHNLKPFTMEDQLESRKLELGYKKVSYPKVVKEYLESIRFADEVKKLYLETFYPKLKNLDTLKDDFSMNHLRSRRSLIRTSNFLEKISFIQKNKVFIRRDLDLQENEWYSIKELKTIIRASYEKFHVKKTPIATDIKVFYRVKEARRGKARGYIILGISTD